jgi:hypothetical protein
MKIQKTPAIVRQFLYLDTEQVRSFVAQIEKGLPEKKERVSLKRQAGGGKGSVRVPTIAEIGINGSVLWESSSTETMSMHHFLFSIFEEAIQRSRKVVKIDRNSRLNTCLDKLREGSVFIFVKGTIQISAVERPFIEPVSQLINWFMEQQRKLVKEGVPIKETGIVPFMDKIPRNLADKLKSLIPIESFVMNITAEKLPIQFHGTLYSKNFQSEDSPNVLLTPPEQAASAITVFGITNTIPITGGVNITTAGITPLAIYREY